MTTVDNSTQTTALRHCMVVYAYYPLAETRVQRQAEALAEQGHQVDVICLRLSKNREPRRETVRGVNVYRLPIIRPTHPWFVGAVPRFFLYIAFTMMAALLLIWLHSRRHYGVVQAHNLPDFLVFCAIWPKLTGAKVILDIHDVMPEFFAENTGRSMQNWLVRLITWQEQISCRFADHVITVTDRWRQALIQRGVTAEKVSVVMNLADHHYFAGSNGAAAASPAGQFRMIYHGTQAERHGLDTLVLAMSQVCREAPDITLTLHGRGDAQAGLRQLVEQLNLSQNICFSIDYLALAELPAFIAGHDVGVIPYQDDLFTGGILPTKLLECMALGLPCIAARTAAMADYFDESMVQFFEPGNPHSLAQGILSLYRDKERRKNLVLQSERFTKKHNWPNESAAYIALIERLNRS
ncbi:MAG: glycosyltransferase family 4 protein [Anaerolineae bacterium]|nr:glycosyltransferase family 4 protein [Anaerolineae bacterium]